MHEHATIVGAVAASEGLCALPGVATQDWCNRAAAALARVRPPAVACLTIATVDDLGMVTQTEAVGVAYTPAPPRNGQEPPPGVSAGTPDLTELRRRWETMAGIGWRPPPGALSATAAWPIDAVQPHWRAGPLGRIWGAVHAQDLVVALAPLEVASPARCLLVEVGLLEPGARAEPHDAEALRVLAGLARRRVQMAFGAARTCPAHWLTTREQIVLDQLALGKSVKQIADDLGRSPHTIHDHVKSLHRKLHASSRGELLARALGHLEEAADARRAPGRRPGLRQSVERKPAGAGSTPASAGAWSARPARPPACRVYRHGDADAACAPARDPR